MDEDCHFNDENGIIGPKAEVTTRLTLTEGGIKDTYAMPTTVLSKGTKGKQIEEPVIRQKPVCHTKHYLYCGCFDKNAAPRMLAKAVKRRKELLGKKRTSQEVIRQTPAHIMSHKNHGDFLPGYDEQSDDWEGGEVKFGKCSCCQEQDAFRDTHENTSSRMSEEGSIKEKNMKDGFTHPTIPQPRWNRPDDYNYEKFLAQEEENYPAYPAKTPPPSPKNKDGTCCLCCPRAPGYVLKRKPSTENNQPREIQYIPMDGKKNHHYYMEEKKYQNYAMDGKSRQPNSPEGKKHQSNSTVKKKISYSTICPLCDNGNKLMELIRKKNDKKPKEDNGQPLFYSNLCKAYQRLMNEYYLTPPGISSPGYVNRPGTF